MTTTQERNLQISVRLRKVAEYLKQQGIIKNDKELADVTNIHKATISQVLSGKTKPSEKFIEKMNSVCEDINIDWIYTGNGSMLRGETTQTDECTAVKSSDNLTVALKTIENLVSQIAEKDKVMAEIITEKDRQIGKLIDMMATEKNTVAVKDVTSAAADV